MVPTFRRPDRLGRLLDALGRQTFPADRFDVLVVDDCSGDGTVDHVAALVATAPFRLRALSTPVNGGPALARNVGWRAAAAPLIAFIDDDCVPSPSWLAAAVDVFEADPALGVVQGHTQVPAGVDWAGHGRWVVYRRIDGPTPQLEGCNIFYRREALEATGGFDEDIRWWGEDSAAGWKVIEAGWGRGFASAAVAVHDVETRGFRSFVRHSYLERNLVRLAAEHPGFRHEYFWRPWAVARDDAVVVGAALSLIGALWWRPLALGALPYAWLRRPARRGPDRAKTVVTNVILDAARAAGHIVGSLRNRILVL